VLRRCIVLAETDEEGERMRRLVVVVAALALLGCPGPPASADTTTVVDASCTSNVDASSPGLPAIYHPCASTDSTLSSGRRHLGPSPSGTCSPEAKGNTGKDYIVWNNGHVSTWEYTRDVSMTNGSVRIHQEGTITAGLFAGDLAVEDLTVVLPGAYLRDPISDQSPTDCQTAEGDTSPEPLIPGRYLATGKLQISPA
jgi:hypothetical protein